MTMGCQRLRIELEHLTIAPDDVIGRQRVDKWLDDQIEAVAALRERYPHSITLHARSNTAIEEMNCFMYALGLKTDAAREFCDGNSIFPRANFVSSLIGTVIKRKTDDAANGDLVIYFDEMQRPLHAGIWKAGRIISKWGSGITHVWEHEPFEIPSSYGNRVEVFGQVSPQQAVSAFQEWAEAQ
jgi:hypothetical protein